ncbi:hypothetical protein AALA83_14305 [Oscillospiraceae bacterium 44-5]
MNFEKTHLCRLPCCYAVSPLTLDGRLKYLLATDDHGPCYCIDAQTLEQETVWEETGGTMSIIPLPGTNGEFLASQRFLPGFAALHARIVRMTRENGRWTERLWMELPYVHRFDLLYRGEQRYFLGCILSTTEEEQADWSKPGTLAAAPVDAGFSPPAALETIAVGMSRNHGYCRMERAGYSEAYTACDQGVFRVAPPEAPGGAWTVEQLLTIPASDVAVCDLDGDGQEELATIEPFHGSAFVIYKKLGDNYREIYRYPTPVDFLHAIWGGLLCGEPVFLAGCRDLDKELFLVRWTPEGPREEIIERGFGPSNVAVFGDEETGYILTANRQSDEGALFTVRKGAER